MYIIKKYIHTPIRKVLIQEIDYDCVGEEKHEIQGVLKEIEVGWSKVVTLLNIN